jgi:hypothetical protein
MLQTSPKLSPCTAIPQREAAASFVSAWREALFRSPKTIPNPIQQAMIAQNTIKEIRSAFIAIP